MSCSNVNGLTSSSTEVFGLINLDLLMSIWDEDTTNSSLIQITVNMEIFNNMIDEVNEDNFDESDDKCSDDNLKDESE